MSFSSFSKRSIFTLLTCYMVTFSSCGLFSTKNEEAQVPVEQKAGVGLLVINVLDESAHQDAHIKGSINVPFEKVEEWAVSQQDKSTPVVTYCANYMCTASGDAAKMLKKAGFNDVYAYEGGIAEWYTLGYPTEGAKQAPYLNDSKKPDGYAPEADLAVISAQELKEKMEKAGIL